MPTDILCPDPILTTFTDAEYQTYDRLNDYSFDRPDAALPFSQRLAKENRWSRDYTDRAIREYKRFAFLAVVAGHPVSPSDQVDQVWHLHLTYTRSYWQEFCDEILNFPLHHEPTQGGAAERAKHHDWYCATLASYDRIFGEAPPADFWPAANVRFGPSQQYARLNTQQHWILPKPQFLRDFSLAPLVRLGQSLPHLRFRALTMICLCLGLSGILVGCQGSFNPLDMTGPDFLGFYLWLNCIVIGAALVLRRMLQPSDQSSLLTPSLNAYEAAYLAGGSDRVVQVAVTQLAAEEYIALDGRSIALKETLPSDANPIDQAIVSEIAKKGNVRSIGSRIKSVTQPLRDRLLKENLLIAPAQAFKVQLYPTLLIGASLLLGLVRLMIGISKQRPVGFLIMLCLIVGFIGLCFAFQKAERSPQGNRVLDRLRKNVSPTSTDLPMSELAMSVALLGTVGLANTAYADWHRYFVPPTSSSSSSCTSGSSCSSGSSCGSSCGGGCGGGCGG
jgi:uncharacterized protein (TIGR04222 family)